MTCQPRRPQRDTVRIAVREARTLRECAWNHPDLRRNDRLKAARSVIVSDEFKDVSKPDRWPQMIDVLMAQPPRIRILKVNPRHCDFRR